MNITLHHFCGFREFRQYLESDGVTPIDCTGGTLTAQVRPEANGELVGEFDIEWREITTGEFDVVMSKDDVNVIPDGVFRWDLIYTDALGTPHKIDEGTCTKRGTVTAPTP
jgi:hypothetical protein